MKWEHPKDTRPFEEKKDSVSALNDSWDTELSQTWPKFTVISGLQLGLKTELLKRTRVSPRQASFGRRPPRSAGATDSPCQLPPLLPECFSRKPNAYLRRKLGFQFK